MAEPHPQTLDPRAAGHVVRYHTWPHVRAQTVAEHSWQLARLLLMVWPLAPNHLVVEALFHDIGERVTGDLPYPTKANDNELKMRMNQAESTARRQMVHAWGAPCLFDMLGLTTDEQTYLKLLEFVEMWEWALDEIALGNKNAVLIRDRCADGVLATLKKLGDDKHITFVAGVVNYVRRRVDYEQEHRS